MSSVPVYIGRWQDHSRSQILGDTITLDVRWGGYLIAALSTFVGLVGTSLWLLIALLIHQWRARPGKQDVLYFQRQAVYRNQGSPSGALWDMLRVCCAWGPRKPSAPYTNGRKEPRVERRFWRSCIFSLPPLIVFLSFTAAGVFIGEVAGPTYETNNVRIKSSRCGFISYDTSTTEGYRAETLKFVNDTIAGRQYAKTCYQPNATLGGCTLYPVQSLPYTAKMVDCPFGADPSGQNSCNTGSGQALQMDTGYLDTDRYLGINAAPANRVLLRNVVTCSPIRINEYVEILNTTDPSYPLLQYNMGEIVDVSGYTYLYNEHTRADIVAYQITPVYALDGSQAWHPVPALNVSNADVSAHFLAQNSVSYLAPVADPWLSSNQLLNDSDSEIDLILYGPDEYVNVMACTDQYQLCNPNSSPYDCTILGSGKDFRNGFLQIGLNPYQLATARRLSLALLWSTTFQTVNSLGSTALLARDRLVDYIGTGLPDNQWQIEVEGWFATSLAKLQAYVVEYAANVADLGPTGSVLSPSSGQDAETNAALDQCSNQRVRNVGGYQSFSFLGLMIVICVGSTIILLSWIVEPLLGRFRRWRGYDGKYDYREVARIADHTLQLQRKAFQGAGFSHGWDHEHLMDQIPVTTRDTLVSVASRHTVDGAHDYHYGDEDSNGSIDSGPGQSMEETGAARIPLQAQPQAGLARPTVSRGPSMQPLLDDHN